MNDGLVGMNWLSRELTSTICLRVLFSKPHGDEAVGGEIGLEEYSGRAVSTKQSFGGEIAAADGAFHGGGPAGGGPVACQEQPGDGGLLLGAPPIDSGLGGKSGGGFLDDGGLYKFSFAGGGQGLAD